MTDMRTAGEAGECPYPVRDYDDATAGPVLSHAEEIDCAARRSTPSCAAPTATGSGS